MITGIFALFFDANVQANGNISPCLSCRGQEFIIATAAVVTGICVSVGFFFLHHTCVILAGTVLVWLRG